MITGYYKDGLIMVDGDEEWSRPSEWQSFILLSDLRLILNTPTHETGK